MNVTELYKKLDELIPRELSCDWDNDGLMCCPEPLREVKKVLFTLDVTESAAEYAVKNGFDVIISHHPMIFKPLPSVTSRKLILLIKNGISVMSFHTRLDALCGGVNTALAEAVGIEDAVPFSSDGIGLIGTLKGEYTPTELAEKVKNVLGAPFAELISSGKSPKKVALVGGDGKDCLLDAVNAGCDTYITGSMSYNSMTDASELGINIIAAGHFFTENPVLGRLEKMITELMPEAVTGQFSCNLIKTV